MVLFIISTCKINFLQASHSSKSLPFQTLFFLFYFLNEAGVRLSDSLSLGNIQNENISGLLIEGGHMLGDNDLRVGSRWKNSVNLF